MQKCLGRECLRSGINPPLDLQCTHPLKQETTGSKGRERMLRGPWKPPHSPGSKLLFPVDEHTLEQWLQDGRGEAQEGRRWENLCRLISGHSRALFISWSLIHGKRCSHCSLKYPNVRGMREFSSLPHHPHFWTRYHPDALGESPPKANKFWWGLVEIFCGRQSNLTKWTFMKKSPHFSTDLWIKWTQQT